MLYGQPKLLATTAGAPGLPALPPQLQLSNTISRPVRLTASAQRVMLSLPPPASNFCAGERECNVVTRTGLPN